MKLHRSSPAAIRRLPRWRGRPRRRSSTRNLRPTALRPDPGCRRASSGRICEGRNKEGRGTDCYETDGKIEAKETFRVPERLFSLLVNAGRDSACFKRFVAWKSVGLLRGCSAFFSDCRRLPPG